jgi:protein-L-isoaspartate(D-aspartate) O-methyltransferase
VVRHPPKIFLDRGIVSPVVLAALMKVRRELFVAPEFAEAAYEDHPLPIGFDQTISQPYMVGVMTDLLKPEKEHRVLEIGTGSGYQTVILAELVHQVYTIELVPELAAEARSRFSSMGYRNIFARVGDGHAGWAEAAPFDRVIVTAASDSIPETLLDQLKSGGRMVIPVGAENKIQELVLLTKDAQGIVTRESIMPVRFVPFKRT